MKKISIKKTIAILGIMVLISVLCLVIPSVPASACGGHCCFGIGVDASIEGVSWGKYDLSSTEHQLNLYCETGSQASGSISQNCGSLPREIAVSYQGGGDISSTLDLGDGSVINSHVWQNTNLSINVGP